MTLPVEQYTSDPVDGIRYRLELADVEGHRVLDERHDAATEWVLAGGWGLVVMISRLGSPDRLGAAELISALVESYKARDGQVELEYGRLTVPGADDSTYYWLQDAPPSTSVHNRVVAVARQGAAAVVVQFTWVGESGRPDSDRARLVHEFAAVSIDRDTDE